MNDGEVMSLAGALLVYRGAKNVFVTVHEALKSDASVELSAGVPVTKPSAAALLAGLDLSLSFRGFVPERLLAIAPGVLAWWCPPAKRTVWFASEDGKGLGTCNGVTQHPGLVFAAAAGKWYVFAVKGANRPDSEARLYRAPYFNVWADRGEICIGNVRTPSATTPESMDGYERAFFESRFTHPNPGFRVRMKGGGYALWRSLLAARGRKPFPQKVLVPTTHTLAQFVRLITETP